MKGLDPRFRKEMKGLYQEICKIPSVCPHLFPESTFDSKLVLVLLSFVSGRLVELVSGHPRPSSVEAPVYRGCPCRAPPVCHRVQDDSVAKRQPFFCVGWSRDIVCSVRSCSWSCFTLMCNCEYTPARLEALLKLSVVTILRHSYHSLQNFCGLWVLSSHLVILFEISSNFSCLLPAVSQSLLFT